MITKTLNLTQFRGSIFDYFNGKDDSSVVIITKRGQSKKALINLDLLEDLLESGEPKLYAELLRAKKEETLTHQDVFGDI
jgi:hypothetical protein